MIAELEAKIEELRLVGFDSEFNISEEIGRLQKRSEELTRKIFDELNTDGKATMMIVGSYRRGATDSGDIDVIITSTKKKTDIF